MLTHRVVVTVELEEGVDAEQVLREALDGLGADVTPIDVWPTIRAAASKLSEGA